MSDSTFHADLDALSRGEMITSNDELLQFAAGLIEEERTVTMPLAHKQRIAGELGIQLPSREIARSSLSMSTMISTRPQHRSKVWLPAAVFAAVVLIGSLGLFRLGLLGDNDGDRAHGIPPAVPTIESSPQVDKAWLSPVTADECPEEVLINRGEWMAIQNQQASDYSPVDRIDAPYGAPEVDDANAVVTRQRQAFGCTDESRLGSTDALLIESPRRSWENSASGSGQRDQIARDRIVRSKALSEYVEAGLGLTANDLIHQTDGEQGMIWDPVNAVQLADGRIALIPSWTTNGDMPDTGLDGFAPVWMNIDGVWLLDEELFFCIGDCDAYWVNLEELLTTPVPSSPEASPEVRACESTSYVIGSDGPINLRPEPGIRGDAVASLTPGTRITWLCESQATTDPAGDGLNDGQVWMLFQAGDGQEGWIREIDVNDDRSWLIPVEPEECRVGDSGTIPPVAGEDSDALPAPYYVMFGPADPTEANAASESTRQFIACDGSISTMSGGYQRRASLAEAGDGFSPSATVNTLRLSENGQLISAMFEESGLVPADFNLVLDGEDPGFGQVEEGTFRVPNPQMVVRLEDGRAVVPMVDVTVDRSGTWNAPDLTNFVGVVYVLEEVEGSWKVDDYLPLCIGDCDQMWQYFSETVEINTWLLPISKKECDANNYLPRELEQEEAAVVRSRQYRACGGTSDQSVLQGPGYRTTEGQHARPTSMEIEGLTRQAGETPGSLQRILDPRRLMEERDLPQSTWIVYQPESVVTLADGRIAVLESTARSSETVGTGSGRTNPVVTTALIWIVDGDLWLLDEEMTVCLGNCDAYWGIDLPSPEATVVETMLLEECVKSDVFSANGTSHPLMPTHLRPGPGNASGVSVATLPANTPLQYLCDQQPTTDPVNDRMDEGQVWVKVRTEDGVEGWMRGLDVSFFPADVPDGTPSDSTPAS